jgi:hypothetical protein
MEPRIPETTSDFTVDWCNRVLEPHLAGVKITSAKAVPFPTPGQTADVASLDFEFDGPTEVPGRLIAKFTAALETTLELAEGLDLYRREVAFYETFGDQGLPVPMCYHAEFSTEGYRFVLLLEDLSAGESPSWAAQLHHIETENHLPGLRSYITLKPPWKKSPRYTHATGTMRPFSITTG